MKLRKMLTIRKLKTIEEYRGCEDIQKAVWKFSDREVIPVNELITAQRNGGVVLGAFDREKGMIGFAFGIGGMLGRKPIHCSRMLAVLPEYRDTGIGFRMKLAQRKFAIGIGLDLSTWTFDPLQSRNAHFNIEKLGVVCREYVVNIYGTSSSVFNAGIDTDRLVPLWFLKSRRVKEAIAGRSKTPSLKEALASSDFALMNTARQNCDGLIESDEPAFASKTRHLLLEMPSDFDGLKAADLKLARDWRAKTRKAFQTCFRRGFQIDGFISEVSEGQRRSFHVFSMTR
jgi:predicted GNAT superfamily acetyltransferase